MLLNEALRGAGTCHFSHAVSPVGDRQKGVNGD